MGDGSFLIDNLMDNTLGDTMGADIVEVTFDDMEVTTEKATLVVFGDKKVWLPLSLILIDGACNVLSMPTWLVEEKELEDFII